MISWLKNDKRDKYSFGKDSEFYKIFAASVGAVCMYDMNRLSIEAALSLENKIRSVFYRICDRNGIFLFNISGVNIKSARKGFSNFEEASNNGMITEWELSIVLSNPDYYNRTIFHNGVNQLIITNRGVKIKWN